MKHLLNSLVILSGAVALSACGGGGGNTNKCSTILPGDLVITEFLKNPKGTDKGQEWFEIHNPGDIELDLVGIDLAISRPDGSQERRHRMLAQLVEAGSYLVVGDAEPGPEGELPGWIDYSYGTSMGTGLPNTAGRIALKCGSTIIDEVIYEDVGTEAYALQLDGSLEPDGVVNDEPANWCDAGDASYDDGTHFGTPGEPNTPCGAAIGGACLDPVTGQAREAIVPEPGQLLITEVMPNPEAVSDANGEWFEVHAPGAAVDLNGLLVGTAEDRGKAVGASETCLTVPAGGYAVLSRKLEPGENGGILALTTFSQNLTNAGGSIALRAGDTVLDVLTYGSSSAGRSLQLSRGLNSPLDNDDPENLCNAEVAMENGDYGTPGAQNGVCPIPLADGACRVAGTEEIRQIVPAVPGDLVISEVMADPAAVSDANGEWFEVLVTRNVDLNGVAVAGTGNAAAPLQGPECMEVAAGSYLIFARNDDPTANGGLPRVDFPFSISLNNSNGALRLLIDDTDLDAITWSSSTAGVSSQVRPGQLTVTGNDAAANFCPPAAGATYGGGDRGTPGVANVCG
jgi:hypothetical protein